MPAVVQGWCVQGIRSKTSNHVTCDLCEHRQNLSQAVVWAVLGDSTTAAWSTQDTAHSQSTNKCCGCEDSSVKSGPGSSFTTASTGKVEV